LAVAEVQHVEHVDAFDTYDRAMEHAQATHFLLALRVRNGEK
jgi:hypothetical protein